MNRWLKISLVLLLVFAILPVMPAQAQTNADCDYYGTHSTSAVYCITMPAPGSWNGDLVIFAHGYVDVASPIDIPWSQMAFSDGVGGTIYMPDMINGMGYAFATTSYSVNGLAVQQGIADVLDLINVFKTQVGTPTHIYLVGASEGGLVTTLAVERNPASFSGGLATCGPIGDFQAQVNYIGDFRVLFDYFMDKPGKDVLPGTAISIPQKLMTKWSSTYVPKIVSNLVTQPTKTTQLMAVSKAAYDPTDTSTIGQTTVGLLWYNVFGTNDATLKLGGQPYDNKSRVYSGSTNDKSLNKKIKRYTASATALTEIANNYQTTGILTIPLVTMHTSGDPIVPAWHQSLYGSKVLAQNPLAPYSATTITRYGHCSFTLAEIQAGFGQLVFAVTGVLPPITPVVNGVQAGSYMYDYR